MLLNATEAFPMVICFRNNIHLIHIVTTYLWLSVNISKHALVKITPNLHVAMSVIK